MPSTRDICAEARPVSASISTAPRTRIFALRRLIMSYCLLTGFELRSHDAESSRRTWPADYNAVSLGAPPPFTSVSLGSSPHDKSPITSMRWSTETDQDQASFG